MGFLGRFIRFVFWVLIVSWLIRRVGRLLGGSKQATRAAGGTVDAAPRGQRLVKDPVCGMHLAEELALPMNANGETQYFCSEECRAKYESSVLRRAANA